MHTNATPRVLVGIDGSPAGAQAMEWAAHEALLRAATLVLAYAGNPGEDVALSPETNAMVAKDASDYGHQLLADAIATLAESYPTVVVRTKLAAGNPGATLVEASRPDDIVVVGRTRGPEIAQLLLGSVSRRVAAHGKGITVIAAEADTGPDAPIAVGVSTSAAGLAAMRFACTEARLRNTSVLGLRAWSAHDWAFATDGYQSGELWSEAQATLLQIWMERACSEFPDIVIETETTHLPVYGALQKASESAQLLVIGCRHRDESLFTRLGPLASWLIDNTTCSLAIVPNSAGADSSTQPEESS